ncbi:ArsR/SmtB family transcription factor [Cytobacillus purgationiresistens]|uniref:DNA-binding transcriptional ArsR family regulator n=1 Tax=Cytobacillus purgationiresistens TaxID=863449 RepID=A0ABU0AQ36_9BACI|nr:metalloregulator ArsR/SmtB family transcription factor [Cytobacillus purgationiresistens]MDQ0273399.1 DNA-binding transcriptional ArsR family regulator [Cytobacillus purgationiresistens]
MGQKTEKDRMHDVCETFSYDEEKVNRVQLRVGEVSGLEQLFKALSDATRIKIAYALTIEDELCVCDVANIIGSSTATASHHLRLLRSIGLAKFRKEGKLAFYSLDDDHVKQLIQVAYAHHKEGVRT